MAKAMIKVSAERAPAVAVETKKEIAQREDLAQLCREVFGSRSSLNYSEIVSGVQKVKGWSESYAEKQTAKAKELGVIQKGSIGRYTFAPAQS
jgi:hypothetical protein